MLQKPNLSIALKPELTPDLITEKHMLRLAECSNVLSVQPLVELTSKDSLEQLAKTEILLTGWGAPAIDAKILETARNLRLIAHTGSSIKSFIAPEAWTRGIAVISAAAANAVPVAEFALAAVLLANKGVFCARERLLQARTPWLPQWIAPGMAGNFGATVGIVGASRTGRKLLELLKPFNIHALIYDPFLSDAEAMHLNASKASLDDLLAACMTVSIHAPALPETFHMIGPRELSLMMDASTLINTARGTLIDHEALEAELISGRLNAILDVTDPEPLPPASPLFDLPNVFLTPHVAGAAGHETQRMTELAIDEIERFIEGRPLLHAVSFDMLARVG